MKEKRSWYAQAVTAILTLAGVLIFIDSFSWKQHGVAGLGSVIVLVFTILALILVTLYNIVIGSSQTNKEIGTNDLQEENWTSKSIQETGIDRRSTLPSIQTVESLENNNKQSLLRVAVNSGAIGILITAIVAIRINSGRSVPWESIQPSAYVSIIEFTSSQTAKVTNPTGDVFVIHVGAIDNCSDDNCLHKEEEDAEAILKVRNRAAIHDKNCIPKGSPPKPPVKMASKEAVFRECVFGTVNEAHLFVSENGDVWVWRKSLLPLFGIIFFPSLFTAPTFALFGVALYKLFSSERK